MSDKIAIEFEGVGKMYRLYKSRLDSFLDITSLGRVAPWWNPKLDHFWALRNVSFKLNAGSRLGIIGRNGAGKTTLLKLITGNLSPTEGHIKVQGEVQALLEAGAGFHPEFSGYENIEASLIQNGFNRSQIKAVVDEIAEFTELGDFLNQPFKSYSAGMQARLVFTTATAIKPEILIIDEVLGAGDAYFAVKSRSRMKQLVDSGASILLVTHAMDQILQFCQEAIWLERGRIVLRGPSLEVVKAYEEFIHTLQDRQLKAANRQSRLGFRDVVEVGNFANTFVVSMFLTGAPGARADVSRVDLRCDDVAEESVRIGDTQDCDEAHFAHIALRTGTWGEPQNENGGHFRSLQVRAGVPSLGELIIRTFSAEHGKKYSFRIRYRTLGEARVVVHASRNGEPIIDAALPSANTEWQEYDLSVPAEYREAPPVAPTEGPFNGGVTTEAEKNNNGTPNLRGSATDVGRSSEIANVRDCKTGMTTSRFDEPRNVAEVSSEQANAARACNKMTVRRWPGEGSLLIESVLLLDADGAERAVYQVRSDVTLEFHCRATKTGTFPVIYTVAIYRLDGIKVSQHMSPRETLHLELDERWSVQLKFPSLDLANGRYLISGALHRDLDPQFPSEAGRYDLLAYSFQFDIVGNLPMRESIFVLPAHWKLLDN